jgi:hypothetical protein
MKNRAFLLVAGSFGLTSVVPVHAQMFQNMAPNFAMNNMVFSNMASQAQRNQANVGQRANRGAQSQPVSLATTAVRYSPSISRRKANLARFVDKARAVDPDGAAKMSQLFASTDVMGMIDQKMQQTYGMRVNNVADAYAVWWVSAWMGANGRSDDATPGQMAMVKRQATNALASTREFASATDAGKQELAEAMLVQAAMIGDTVDTYKSDPAMLAKTRAAIAKGAREMGLDLNSMKLTDEGFVPSGKTGSVSKAPGASEQALATNAAPVPSAANDTSPPYLLLATAGGAGIGGVYLLGKMMGKFG